VRFLVERGIPVCAHLGLTPQSVHALGGYRVQGARRTAARTLLRHARELADAGAAMLVLELMPSRWPPASRRRCPSHHRHRRRPALQRPGAGAARHARLAPASRRASCATSCEAQRHRACAAPLRGAVKDGAFPDPELPRY
jgi:hypothetical protein